MTYTNLTDALRRHNITPEYAAKLIARHYLLGAVDPSPWRDAWLTIGADLIGVTKEAGENG
jgi:hypothetical protein